MKNPIIRATIPPPIDGNQLTIPPILQADQAAIHRRAVKYCTRIMDYCDRSILTNRRKSLTSDLQG